jgi:cytochrome c553
MYLAFVTTQTSLRGFSQVARALALCGLVMQLATTRAMPALAGSSGVASDMMALGRHLAAECVACHRVARLDGAVSQAIPGIVGRPADELIALLKSYAAGEGVADRPVNAVMVSVAQSLNEGERAAVAAYLGSQAALR